MSKRTAAVAQDVEQILAGQLPAKLGRPAEEQAAKADNLRAASAVSG